MSSPGCGVSDVVDRVVVVELALRLVRHEPENADVPVGHDRAPGSGNAIETAVGWGSSWGRSSGPTRRKPKVRSRLVIGWGESPHSGQAVMYAAAAGVKRSRQAGQQRWVMAVITSGSSRGGRPRTLGRLGSSRGPPTARRSARSTPGGARALTHAEGARTRGSYRSIWDRVCVRALAAPAARSALRWPFRLAAEAAALVQPTLGIPGVS